MKLRKVISGGQTGADQTGVEEAAKLGLETGGTMPKGYRTEKGPDPYWGLKYGLVADASDSYVPRTRKNAQDADVTLWFGRVGSPGYWCTRNACRDYGKPFVLVVDADIMTLTQMYPVWNVAGNRASTNPSVVGDTRMFFNRLKLYMEGSDGKEQVTPVPTS